MHADNVPLQQPSQQLFHHGEISLVSDAEAYTSKSDCYTLLYGRQQLHACRYHHKVWSWLVPLLSLSLSSEVSSIHHSDALATLIYKATVKRLQFNGWPFSCCIISPHSQAAIFLGKKLFEYLGLSPMIWTVKVQPTRWLRTVITA